MTGWLLATTTVSVTQTVTSVDSETSKVQTVLTTVIVATTGSYDDGIEYTTSQQLTVVVTNDPMLETKTTVVYETVTTVDSIGSDVGTVAVAVTTSETYVLSDGDQTLIVVANVTTVPISTTVVTYVIVVQTQVYYSLDQNETTD